jgi:small subunit ribosomal protein S9
VTDESTPADEATQIPAEEEPSAEAATVEEPVTEAPAAEEPVAEAPAADEPAAEEPAAEVPATEEPAAEARAAEEPAAEEPAAEEPAAEEPAAEEPAAEEPAAEEPAAEEPEVPPTPRPMPVSKGGRPAASLGTGRRKEAVARVRLVEGTGQFNLGGRTLEEVFPNRAHRMQITAPLRIADRERDLDVVARLHGGGVAGQAGALRHGIARALIELDPELRGRLKAEGFLTRDSREKERRKYGLKKARKAPQYSKR